MKQKALLAVITIKILLLAYNGAYAQKIRKRKIRKLFKHSVIVKDHFTGFALYDMDKGKMIYELNAGKYFTPASNTKLFTFYTCLKMLGDSVPALKYVVHNDSLVFWGTGDPSFLHRYLNGINGFDFLKNTDKKLFFSPRNPQSVFYGAGWAWDDYKEDYQPELTELPIKGNIAVLYAAENGALQIEPSYLKAYLVGDSSYKPASFNVKRNFLSNTFVYPAMKAPSDFKQEIPWKTSTALTLALLQDTLKKEIGLVHISLTGDAKTIYDVKADSVYKRMLQVSDNFLAEQLLLVCSFAKFGVLNTDSVIRYAKANFLGDLPDAPKWADGSGLSRYNLFTPASMVALLCKISQEINNEERLHSLMPAGGLTGTIANAYQTDNGGAFVWAKTGSMSNVYNQSGYLVTRKGKHLAFSFMNNNFTRPTREIREEIARIITFIHQNY